MTVPIEQPMIFAMAVVNIIALYLLMPIVKRELNSYFARLDSGEIRKFAARPHKAGTAAAPGP